MKNIDKLQDVLEMEITDFMHYNEYLVRINKPEIRQLLTQLRDEHMMEITELQQQIHVLMGNQ
ncbi:hypothetical protein [Vallitalea maricola]|uniref:Uncharacterized protein n=1 Tax=Vallitalea maricola TaxID=3074433 RepID=A0ACB5UQM5_9FIRM|nr:hypothetical protein AN2V17_40900 [Vallitalea sp. AN17-2]